MNKINWQERLNQLLSTGRNKSYFTAGVTVLFVVLMSLVGVVPAISSLSTQAEDNYKRDVIISRLERKLKDLKTLTLAQDSNTDLVDYFNQIMPEDNSQEAVINLINTMATKRNILINGFNFDNESRELLDKITIDFGERITGMYLTITASGKKEDTLNFLKDIESSALIMNIEDLSISRNTIVSESGSQTISYALNLKMIIYSYKNTTE